MNYKKIIFLFMMALVVETLCFYYIASIYAEENLNNLNNEELIELYNSQSVVNVDFYRWDRKANQKEEFIGTAELKGGKLTYKVTDKRLEKMLKGDFHTMVTVEKNGKSINKFITYKVGTVEHFQSVIEHCKDISCIAEIVKK